MYNSSISAGRLFIIYGLLMIPNIIGNLLLIYSIWSHIIAVLFNNVTNVANTALLNNMFIVIAVWDLSMLALGKYTIMKLIQLKIQLQLNT